MIQMVSDGDVLISEDGYSVMVLDVLLGKPKGVFVVDGMGDISIHDVVDIINKYHCKIVTIECYLDNMHVDLSKVAIDLLDLSLIIMGKGCVVDLRSRFSTLISFSLLSEYLVKVVGSANLHCLRKAEIDYRSGFLDKIVDNGLLDLRVHQIRDEGWRYILDFNFLSRLELVSGSLDSLEGFSRMRLETIRISRVRNLLDVREISSARCLKSVMFEKFSGVQDWSFLSGIKCLQHIHLTVANSLSFVSRMPLVTHLYCENVLDGDYSILKIIEERRSKWGSGVPFGLIEVIPDVYEYQC